MRRCLLLSAIFIFAGCANNNSETRVLPQDKMTRLLWDMIQVDELATLQMVKDTGKNVKTERVRLYQKVFQLHNTSEKQFSKSFSYYTGHPDLLKNLFDSLEARGVNERKIFNLSKEPGPK